uniref:40S ribosomal protein S3-1-like n=1 Tax=Rhizophora mucronata TaxID=61149 RepID=A0A2P2LRM6_RHIMU
MGLGYGSCCVICKADCSLFLPNLCRKLIKLSSSIPSSC